MTISFDVLKVGQGYAKITLVQRSIGIRLNLKMNSP